jgi:transcriptional regulator with XRE-family HTH domain
VPSRPKKPRNRDYWQRAIVRAFKALREDADLDRKELGESMGLTYSQIVNIENGRRAVGLIDFFMLAQALDLEPGEVLGRIVSMGW